MRRALAAGLIASVAFLPLASGCGGGCGVVVDVDLDVRGASNTPCTVTVAHGDHTASFDVAAPDPPVADTSLAPRRAINGGTCGDTGVAVTPNTNGHVTATRSATDLCLSVGDVRDLSETLGVDCPSGDYTITLSCAGAALYDHVALNVCSCQG